jgi:hypothetical protein
MSAERVNAVITAMPTPSKDGDPGHREQHLLPRRRGGNGPTG